jgi:hypothetical protein
MAISTEAVHAQMLKDKIQPVLQEQPRRTISDLKTTDD